MRLFSLLLIIHLFDHIQLVPQRDLIFDRLPWSSVEDENNPSDCSCTCEKYETVKQGRNVGYCNENTNDREGVWCFVLSTSPCSDKTKTSHRNNADPKKYYYRSYQACVAPKRCYETEEESAADKLPRMLAHDQDIERVPQRDLVVDRLPWSSVEDIHNPSDCSCICEKFETVVFGNTVGYCNNVTSESKGVWCYVLSTSNCYDKEVTWQKNSEDPNPPKHYYRSYEACVAPRRCYETEEESAADKLPRMLAHDQDLGRAAGGEDIAAPEEPTYDANKKHVAVDITMHFKNHMSPNGDVSTALGTE